MGFAEVCLSRRRRYRFWAALVVALCGPLPLHAQTSPPAVLASVAPLHSLVAGVMDGVGEPALLLAGGSSPHVQSLRPSQRWLLDQADAVFWVGPELEPFLSKPLAASSARVVALLTVVPVRLDRRRGGVWGDDHEHDHERVSDPGSDGDPPGDAGRERERHALDPHFWLDPQNAAAAVRYIADVLSELDPASAPRYAANAARLDARLGTLSATLRTQLAPLRDRPVAYVVFHDAYRYFENRFGLRPLGAMTLEPSRRPGAARLRELRQALRAQRARCVFSEPQFPPRLLATLVEGSDINVGELDPLGATLTPGGELYFQLLHNLAAGIRQCLTR